VLDVAQGLVQVGEEGALEGLGGRVADEAHVVHG
jgi:hypothetical protein